MPTPPEPETCSYCDAPIDPEMPPLRLWQRDGSMAVFCDGCAGDIFGLSF